MQCIWKQNHKNKRFLCVLNSDLGTLFWFIFTCSALVPQTCVLLGQLTSARSFYDSPCRNLRLQPSQALLSSHRLPNSPSHHDEILFRALSVCFWQWPQRVPQGFPHSSAGKEFACDAGDTSSIPGTGRSPGEGIGYPLQYSWASLEAQMVKNPLTLQETWVWSLGWKGPLEKEKATHSRILSWRILWTVESMGSQRVGQDWVTLTFTFGKYNFNLGGLIAFNLDSSFFFPQGSICTHRWYPSVITSFLPQVISSTHQESVRAPLCGIWNTPLQFPSRAIRVASTLHCSTGPFNPLQYCCLENPMGGGAW